MLPMTKIGSEQGLETCVPFDAVSKRSADIYGLSAAEISAQTTKSSPSMIF